MRRLIFLIGSLLFVGACGSTPAAPTAPSPANVAGGWSGTITTSNYGTQSFTMLLTQAASTVNGTWTSPSFGWTGAVSGTVTPTNFSGTMSLSGVSTQNVPCSAVASVSGNASSSTMTWTSPFFTAASGPCGNQPANVRIDMQLR